MTEIGDLNPDEDSAKIVPKVIPSLLHHIDKTKLEQYSLEQIFSKYDAWEDSDEAGTTTVNHNGPKFATNLTEASKYRSQISVIQAAKEAFQQKYMS